MLKWTGHALVDVGIATLCAMARRNSPETLRLEDLDAAADEMERYYFSGGLTSYLTCVFMNSEYVQPGEGAKKDESRRRYAERVLRAYRHEGDPEAKGRRCAFSGEAATHRIHRGQMPLLTGEDVLNFFADSVGGLLISGPYLTALQALPLGGRRSEGKLLVVHCDSAELTLAFAAKYLEDNRRLLALAMSGGLPKSDGPSLLLPRENAGWDTTKKQPKYPDAKAAFSLIASDLQDILSESTGREAPASLQAYWLSSSGQGPSLDVFSVPSPVLRYLRLVSTADLRGAWTKIVSRGWNAEPTGKAGKKSKDAGEKALTGPGRSRNPVLHDLLSIYADGFLDEYRARRFVRIHLLTEAGGRIERAEEVQWGLTEFFLREVLGMSPERIERIRQFADMLAEYIKQQNDRPFFKKVTFARYSRELRGELVKAQRNEFQKHTKLLFTLDEYLTVFEGDEGAGVSDWSLIRDLICIRLVEQLSKAGWLTAESLKADEEEATVEPTGV